MQTDDFLRMLWRGGAWAYLWRSMSEKHKETLWFPAQTPPPVPEVWTGSNIYFGVHPTAAKGKPHSRSLKVADPARPDSPPVAVVNCLFAEFDANDFGGDKAAILAHLETRWQAGLPYPSVLVDSGGGYHAYWLLEYPHPLDDDDARADAIATQAAWVTLWGGDDGAKDLARVLRLPGTLNHKYSPPRLVSVHSDTNLGRVYGWERLASYLPAPTPALAPAPTAGAPSSQPSGGRSLATWVDRQIASVRHAKEGARNKTTNQVAYKLGRLVGSRELDEGGLVDRITTAARDAGLPEVEARKEATGGMADGRENPRKWIQTERESGNGARQARVNGAAHAPVPAQELPAVAPAHTNGIGAAAVNGAAPVGGFRCTDLGNARRLVARHGADLRYCFPWASWLAWNGCHWRRDDAGEVFRRAKSTVSAIYQEAAAADGDERRKELAKWAMRSEARDRVAAMLDLARSEDPLPVLPDDFDRNPWLLNVANGTIDLRTGVLRPHARDDLLSKVAPVAYDPAAECPLWLAFLNRILGADQALISYLQRAVGYALTGDVSEQVLFFLHGGGSNGKSTFLATILAMLGRDYGTQAAPELLIAGNRHPTEVADLHGKRFVASIEVEDGRRMAEGLVKQMTGGDQMKARFMKADFFQFDPTFKLFLSANHKPVITGTDYAIWRRIRLIPFAVKITEQEKDPRLPEKLRGELAGILAWAVRGCLAWQNEGLQAPAPVADATAAYRAESDLLGAFLAECTVDGAGLRVQAKELYTAYVAWCEANTEKPLTGTAFGRELTTRGADKYKEKGTNHTFYIDMGLLHTPQNSHSRD